MNIQEGFKEKKKKKRKEKKRKNDFSNNAALFQILYKRLFLLAKKENNFQLHICLNMEKTPQIKDLRGNSKAQFSLDWPKTGPGNVNIFDIIFGSGILISGRSRSGYCMY